MTTNPFSWQEIPFLRLFIALILGIVAADYWQLDSPIFVNIMLSLSFICIFILAYKKMAFRWRWAYGIPLSIFLFLLGFQSVYYHNELNNDDHFKNNLANGNEKLILGIVTDHVEKAANYRLNIAVQKIGSEADSFVPVSGNLLVYLKKDTFLKELPQYGDLVLLDAKISEVEPPKNPDAFDFKQYLHFQNIHFQSFVQNTDIRILSHNRGNLFFQIMSNAQLWLIKILKTYLTTDREFAVGSALILGYRDAITDEVKAAYIGTGSMHILAVSGMHLMLIFNRLERFLNFYKTGNRRWRWSKAAFIILLMWSFALLTGFGASIVRAALMSTISTISKAWKRPLSIYNVLAASAFLILLVNPFWLYNVGFQLSYLAVIGIVYFQPKLRKLLIFNNKAANWVWEITTIGFAAQLAVTPISLYYFHQFPTYFWLSGLLAVEVSSWALGAGVISLFTFWIPYIGTFIGKILFCLIWILNEIVFFVQKLPFSIFKGFWLTTLSVFFIYIILIGFALAIKTRRLKAVIYPLSILMISSLFYAFSDIKVAAQKEIIVYHVYKNSVVDFVDGQKCYSFSEKFSLKNDTLNKIKFATENHRMKLKINKLEVLEFYISKRFPNLCYYEGISQFYTYRMVTLDKLPENTLILQANFVLVRQNARFSISDLLKHFQFETVIFDGSNARWRVEKWKKECHDLGIPFHDTFEKGAWVKKI